MRRCFERMIESDRVSSIWFSRDSGDASTVNSEITRASRNALVARAIDPDGGTEGFVVVRGTPALAAPRCAQGGSGQRGGSAAAKTIWSPPRCSLFWNSPVHWGER